MDYVSYRLRSLPTTSVWRESAIKEMNDRVIGDRNVLEQSQRSEAILKIRAAALSNDDRLVRLPHKPTRPIQPQARYRAVRLLDETAALACAAPVDLNLIRAALADTIERSDFN